VQSAAGGDLGPEGERDAGGAGAACQDEGRRDRCHTRWLGTQGPGTHETGQTTHHTFCQIIPIN